MNSLACQIFEGKRTEKRSEIETPYFFFFQADKEERRM